ncbi:manganese/zinc/iron transport system permease protein [Sporobacter termitidis DSM 10068]|uniref:Manganese/zinc/iron transport system permease protein n=1 Tax=Sporobacter termitidis DSM 10068 TaxID=1123282 RepID=A0A1M5W4J1_9FIRM|nr:hypothetical protein [Sporobacter termitidis]SHH82432.1 manganese/zinc/iron transport system permease protein [Sporobacter termitidis DSM 10068]
MMFLFHLYNHDGSEDEAREAGFDTIQAQLHWDAAFTSNIMALLKKEDCIEFTVDAVKLTEQGRINSVRNYEALFSK